MKQASTAQRIGKNFSFLVLGEIISKLLLFFFIIYATRKLGDVDFGKLSFALAFAGIFVILSDFGLNYVVIREITREKSKARKIVSTASFIELVFMAATFCLVLIIISVTSKGTDQIVVVAVITSALLINQLSQLYRNVFQAFEKMEYESLMGVVSTIVLVSIGFFILHNSMGLRTLVFAYLIASGVNLIFSMSLCYNKFSKYSFKLDMNLAKKLLSESWPFAINAIFTSIYFNIGTVILKYMVNDQVTGWYSAAYRMVAVTTVVPALYCKTIYPVLSSFYKDSREALGFVYRKSFKYLLILAVPLGVGTTMLADRIVLFFLGGQYLNSILSLKILIWASSIIFLGTLVATMLNSMYRQKVVTYATFVGALVNTLLNIFLIRYYGYIGAAIATVVTEMFVLFIVFRNLKTHVEASFFNITLLKILVCSAVMAIVLHLLSFLHILMLIPAAVFAYFLALLFTKTMDKSDFELVSQLCKTNIKSKAEKT